MKLDADAVVVGGGPAGASAALSLVDAGARVVLLERERPPRYKTCGGGLVGRALAALPTGFEVPVERSFHAVSMQLFGSEQAFRVEREEPVVVATMRAPLDAALLEHARRAGVRVESPRRFLGLERETGGIRVRTDRGTLNAGLVIGADGALGPVARAAGWSGPPASVPALEAEVQVDEAAFRRLGADLRFDLGIPSDGYGWVFPKARHLSVGVLAMRRGARTLKRTLGDYLRALDLTPRELELHGFVIPLGPRMDVARPGVLLVGDAAGLADPLTAEGISYALRSGRLVGAAWRTGGGHPERVGAAYGEALAEELLPELRWAGRLARPLYGRPRLRRWLFARSGRSLCEGMTDVVLGARSARELLLRPRSYIRLLVS